MLILISSFIFVNAAAGDYVLIDTEDFGGKADVSGVNQFTCSSTLSFGGKADIEGLTEFVQYDTLSFGGKSDVITYTPDAPILTGATADGTQITITWTDDDEADSTYIEWDSVNDTSWNRGDHNDTGINASSGSEVHSGLEEGKTYYYKAWSWNSTGAEWSSGSNVLDATTFTMYWYTETFGGKVDVEEPISNLSIESKSVNYGDTFTVHVNLTPVLTQEQEEEGVVSWEFAIEFDNNRLQANSVIEGDLFSGKDVFFSDGNISNDGGNITDLYNLVFPSSQGGVNESGSCVNISFTSIGSGDAYIRFFLEATEPGITNKSMYLPLEYSNGTITVGETDIDCHLNETTWTIGELGVGNSVTKNFKFWQNGTVNIDVDIGINNTNFTFVNYTDWVSNGYNQICANFTNDSWVTEHNIKISPYNGTLKVNFAPGNFEFGVRLYLPKSMDAVSKKEDFEVILTASEHT